MRHELDDAERSRGGKRSAQARRGVRTVSPEELPPDPTTHAETVQYQMWVIRSTGYGKLDARTAHEMLLGLAIVARTMKEVEDARRQIKDLRAELNTLKKRLGKGAR